MASLTRRNGTHRDGIIDIEYMYIVHGFGQHGYECGGESVTCGGIGRTELETERVEEGEDRRVRGVVTEDSHCAAQ